MKKNSLPNEPQAVLTEVSDPQEVARFHAVREQFQRNSDWLQAHWPELLPQARGRFLAVAGQQAFLGDSVEEVLALAQAAHPQDKGVLTQFVLPAGGPRIYAPGR
jgi:hypothetical protein